MKIHDIDLHIHTILSKEACANLSVKSTLKYYQLLGERAGEKYVIRINDHDTIFGGLFACEEYFANRDKYPNIFVIPGIEFNANLSYVLKCEDSSLVDVNTKYPNSDEKYKFVFKNAHISAAPILRDMEDYKRWRNNMDLRVYSKLAKMHLDLSKGGKYYFKDQMVNLSYHERFALTNLGEQLIGYKNLVRKYFGVKIPFREYKNCVKEGLTYKQILDEFNLITVVYMKNNYPPFKKMSEQDVYGQLITAYATGMKKTVCNFEKKSIEEIENILLNLRNRTNNFTYDLGGLRRLHFDELCEMVEQGGGVIDFAHPNKGFLLHENSMVSTDLLKNIDFSIVDVDDQYEIAKNGKDYDNPAPNRKNLLNEINTKKFVNLTSLLGGKECKADFSGLIKIQLFQNALKQSNFKLPNGVLGAEITKGVLKNTNRLPAVLNVMDKAHILCTLGSDKHLNIVDKFMSYAPDKPLVTLNNGSVKVINQDFVKELHSKVKDRLELNDDINAYNLPSDQIYHTKVKNLDKNENTMINNHKDRIIQLSYLDKIIGKDVDFSNYNQIAILRGSIVNSMEEISEKDKYYANNLKRVLIDLYDYADIRNNKQNKKYMQEIDKITAEVSQKFLELKKDSIYTDERAMESYIDILINKNRKIIDSLKLANINENIE